jgi:hypothetical protein
VYDGGVGGGEGPLLPLVSIFFLRCYFLLNSSPMVAEDEGEAVGT